MIKTTEQRKKQKILLIVAIVIFIIAILVLYFAFWQGGGISYPETIIEEGGSIQGVVLEKKLEKIKLDPEFLNESIFSFLRSFGDLPVEKGETGRENPFIPY